MSSVGSPTPAAPPRALDDRVGHGEEILRVEDVERTIEELDRQALGMAPPAPSPTPPGGQT